MIRIENVEVTGFDAAIRGMRNPMNSWDRSDSYNLGDDPISTKIPHVVCKYQIGSNDHALMMKLASGGPVHAKYRRMITVYLDITAPLYLWREFDTYKVGTVANSCSTMHKIHENEFTIDDFSHEHLGVSTFGVNENGEEVPDVQNLKEHKLDEWREFCDWIKDLPYSEVIVGTDASA